MDEVSPMTDDGRYRSLTDPIELEKTIATHDVSPAPDDTCNVARDQALGHAFGG